LRDVSVGGGGVDVGAIAGHYYCRLLNESGELQLRTMGLSLDFFGGRIPTSASV